MNQSFCTMLPGILVSPYAEPHQHQCGFRCEDTPKPALSKNEKHTLKNAHCKGTFALFNVHFRLVQVRPLVTLFKNSF